jgi:L-lactate dehydrogenase complex protein LldG
MNKSSRERILQKIRKALVKPVPSPFPGQDPNAPVYPNPDEDLSVLFASEFTRLLGKFAYCADERALAIQVSALIREKSWEEVYCAEEPLRAILSAQGTVRFSGRQLADSDVSVTSCEALVARTGSIVLSAALTEGRTASVYAPVHICVARTSQLVWDISDALKALQEKYPQGLPSLVSFATGPSRTADIEKTLVVGVHGPREVYCFLVEDHS